MRLGVVQGDGAALRTHLLRLRQSTGLVDPQLAESLRELPANVAHIWQAFVALSYTRGEASIACTEIEAWQRLSGVRLSPWEFETLQSMDRAALTVADEERSRRPKGVSA